jgi:hypothetical protein
MCAVIASVAAADKDICTSSARVSVLPGVSEASGAALGRRTPGVIWSHADSGEPVLFAIDASGSLKGRVAVTGARVLDWEDLTSGGCGQRNCLFIADIGDNRGTRRNVTIYRVAEPPVDAKTTEPATALQLEYPDGRAHDAEALFATSNGQLFLITKEAALKTTLYRVPQDASEAAPARLETVAWLPIAHVTGASSSGDWVAIRTNRELFFYRLRNLMTGSPGSPERVDLRMLKEPQGEGVALNSDGTVFLVGEGGRGGTFAKLQCRLP